MKSLKTKSKTVKVVLCGNPNSGKSTIFNRLTGLRQKVANYPGVTVEAHQGTFHLSERPDTEFEIIDIPGCYSLAALSPDEFVAVDLLLGRNGSDSVSPPDVALVVLDATNLDRSLYLMAQISEAGIPMIAILNQVDIILRGGKRINTKTLSSRLGVAVFPTVGHTGKGIDNLRSALAEYEKIAVSSKFYKLHPEIESFLQEYHRSDPDSLSRPELLRALFDRHGPAEKRFLEASDEPTQKNLETLRHSLSQRYRGLPFAEAYPLAEEMGRLAQTVTALKRPRVGALTDKIDAIVLHRVWGPVILLAVMALIFQSIFTWAEPVMNMIDSVVGALRYSVSSVLAPGPLSSLITNGIIGGVGSVIVFLPQILILFFFLGLLEDSGYLPRAAFIVDRLFRWCGLSGRSFVPLLSSFACAIPGIMATRVIESRRQRLLTILVAPLMSCSARLPVYTIMISAFVPYSSYLGIFNSQGLTLIGLYGLGVVTAMIVSLALKGFILKGAPESSAMELPIFKPPTISGIWLRMSISAKAFIKRAGTMILAISIIVWALSYYPHPDNKETQLSRDVAEIVSVTNSNLAAIISSVETRVSRSEFINLVDEESTAPAQYKSDSTLMAAVSLYRDEEEKNDRLILEEKNKFAGESLRQSYFGRAGKTLEPFFAPLGWDWKITMAALASFPAREVVIATLGTIYNLGPDENETSSSLISKMRSSRWESGPKEGEPVFNVAVAMSIMVFFALCCQCGATLAVIRRETNSWFWAAFTFSYMTALAYFGAWGTYSLVKSIIS